MQWSSTKQLIFRLARRSTTKLVTGQYGSSNCAGYDSLRLAESANLSNNKYLEVWQALLPFQHIYAEGRSHGIR